MDCFKHPNEFTNRMIQRQTLALVIALYASFSNRKTKLTLFFLTKLGKKIAKLPYEHL